MFGHSGRVIDFTLVITHGLTSLRKNKWLLCANHEASILQHTAQTTIHCVAKRDFSLSS